MLSRPRRFLALLAVPALVLAASPANAQAPAKKAAPKKTAAAKPLPPIFDPDAVGTKAVEAGVNAANESARRIFIVFGTNDCAPCRVVNRAMHAEQFYDALARQFTPIMIDVTPGSRNLPILSRFGIDPAKGLPAVVVFDRKFQPVSITKNGEMVKLAAEGDAKVQEWFLQFFEKDKPAAQ